MKNATDSARERYEKALDKLNQAAREGEAATDTFLEKLVARPYTLLAIIAVAAIVGGLVVWLT